MRLKTSRLRALAVVCLALASAFVSVGAQAAGFCIEDTAKQALACAPAPQLPPTSAAVAAVPTAPTFHSASPRAASSTAPKAPAAPVAAALGETEVRPWKLVARERGLLVVELERLERLFGPTKRNAPDRLMLARRLADECVELEAAAFRDRTEAEIRRDVAQKKSNLSLAQQEQATVVESDRLVKSARKRAAELYTLMANDWVSYEIGRNYQALAVYDHAAEWYEKYASANPRAPDADRALADAVLLRLGLGQESEAVKDAADFVRVFGSSRPAMAGGIAFAIGAHHAEKGDWEKVCAALEGASTQAAIDRAPPDVQIQAHATLGRALARLGPGREASARAEYAKARSAWAEPAAAEQKIRAAYPAEDDAQRDRRVGRAVAAVGEALFFAAEDWKAGEVDRLRFPEYRGPGDAASVRAHVATKVRDWYTKKKAAIVHAEHEYAKVLDLKPKAPPRWIIAAASRSGLMWGDFVDDFRRAPIPREWRGTPLEHVYTTALDESSEPLKVEHAKPALKKCLELSVSQQFFDGFSRSCEVWLAKHYKAEYHVVDELRGAAALPNDGLEEQPPPLALDRSATGR